MTTPSAAAARILPDADLTPELVAFARDVRAFATAKLAPHARTVDERIEFRREMVTDLGGAGLLGGAVPADLGGNAWSAMELAIANEELGAVCGNARGFVAVQAGLVCHALVHHGSAEQRARWLPELVAGRAIGCFGLTEEHAGSDVASLRCRAVPDPQTGGYRITGRKIWITNGGVADVVLLFATIDPEQKKDGITAFLVPVDSLGSGFRREPMPGVELGHRGSDHAQLVFDDVAIPADAVVGGERNGFDIAMSGLSAGRLSVAAGAVGIHRAALASAIEFATSRVQFGKPIAAFQMVQERVADLAVELLAARELVHRCARRRDAGTEDPLDLAAAKLYATEAAARAADQAIQLHGGRGYSSAYPAERLLRDAIGLRIYEGTSMIQKSIVARRLLRDG